MRLVHFTDKPLPDVLEYREQHEVGAQKPRGLWVSDESQFNGWRWWCEGMEWDERIAYAYAVTLAPDARILHLWPHDLTEFTRKHKAPEPWAAGLGYEFCQSIDWRAVAAEWQGVVLTPYDREAALDSMLLMWAYSFDCASGCIWDPAAIASIEQIEPPTAHSGPGHERRTEVSEPTNDAAPEVEETETTEAAEPEQSEDAGDEE